MNKHLLFLIILFFSFKLFSQPYSGIYTIGGSTPDFNNVQNAFDSLELYGISGPVILNIRFGTYSGSISVDSIPGNDSINKITLQSELLDSTTVILNFTPNAGENYLMKINKLKALDIKYLSFRNFGIFRFGCLSVLESGVNFESCNFYTRSRNRSSDDSNSLLNFFGSGIYNCQINNCTFDGGSYGVYVSTTDSLKVFNCQFSRSRYGCFYLSANNILLQDNLFDSLPGNDDNSYLESKYLNMVGNIFFPAMHLKAGNAQVATLSKNSGFGQIYSLTCDSIFFYDNKFDSLVQFKSNYCFLRNNKIRTINFSSFKLLADSNEFYFFGVTNVDSAGLIINNSFTDRFYVYNSDSLIIKNNIINTSVSSENSNVYFINNIINELDFNLNKWCFIIGNRITRCLSQRDLYTNIENNIIDKLHISSGTITVVNNYILKDLAVGSSGLFLYNNNVRALNVYFQHCPTIRSFNNNFYSDIYFDQNISFVSDYNNYFPAIGNNEPHNTYVDPLYQDSINLNATNPLLTGKGKYLGNPVIFDFDSVFRKNPPTIGANEIFTPFDSSNMTFYVSCGDNLSLSIGEAGNNYSFKWHPGWGLSDSTISNPALTAYKDTSYIVEVFDSIQLIVKDTININVVNFQVNAGSTIFQPYCGYPVQLTATWNPNATYLWSPGKGLNDSTLRTPNETPIQTMKLYVTATIPGCGSSIDSVIVDVNPIPVAYAVLNDVNYNYFSFLNQSTCADTYHWNFGDGSISTDENPIHIFNRRGNHLVILIACNDFGCDTLSGYVYVDSLVIIDSDNLKNNHTIFFRLYPNPTSGKLKIEFFYPQSGKILVENSGGVIIQSTDLNLKNREEFIDIDLSKYPPGIYFVHFITTDGVFSEKLILY